MPRLTHAAPRPFSQLARRAYRLGLDTRYRPFLSNFPYRQGRRRPAAGTGYYALHRRRIRLDIQCRRAGMQMVRPGVWRDASGVLFAGYDACDWGQW